MREEFLGAQALKGKFEAVNHPADVTDDILRIDHWHMMVRMIAEQIDKSRNNVSVSYRAITFCDRLTYPVVDYAIGWGKTLEEANKMAAEMYMGSVFPVIHSICCVNQCGYGIEQSEMYASDRETGLPRDWRLIRGPGVRINCDESVISEELFARMLEDKIHELASGSGSYWFKCFVGQLGENVDADCYVNNVSEVDYKNRFVEFGHTLPENVTCKQHLLLYPVDPELIAQHRAARQQLWIDSLDDIHPAVSSDDLEKVLMGFRLFSDFAGMDESFLRWQLQTVGVESRDALRLVSFLPAVCARNYWRPQGVQFSDEYTLINYDQKSCETRSLVTDEIYLAAEEVYRIWNCEGIETELLASVRDFSAESSGLYQCIEDGAKASDIKMTYLLVPTDESLSSPIPPDLAKSLGLTSKPWWKFW